MSSKKYDKRRLHYEPVLMYYFNLAYKTGQYVEICLNDGKGTRIIGEIVDITPDSVILVADECETRGKDGTVLIDDIYTITVIYRLNEKRSSSSSFSGSGLRHVHCKDDMSGCW